MRNSKTYSANGQENRIPARKAGHLLSQAALVAALALGLVPVNVAALDMREVEAVVTILERLSVETGKTVFFDEEAAQEWFEIDDEALRLIPASGFTGASWKDAFDQTMAGFIAAIPPAELETMIDELAARLDETGKMTQGQNREVKAMLHAQIRDLEDIRSHGAHYRGIVSPYFARLKSLSQKK